MLSDNNEQKIGIEGVDISKNIIKLEIKDENNAKEEEKNNLEPLSQEELSPNIKENEVNALCTKIDVENKAEGEIKNQVKEIPAIFRIIRPLTQ